MHFGGLLPPKMQKGRNINDQAAVNHQRLEYGAARTQMQLQRKEGSPFCIQERFAAAAANKD